MILLINTIAFALFQLICGCLSSFSLIVKLRYLTPNTQSFQNVITTHFVSWSVLELWLIDQILLLQAKLICLPCFNFLLKLHKGTLYAKLDSSPPLTLGNDPIVSPLAILDSKVTDVDGTPTHFVFVQWMEFSLEGTTWEKWDELCKAYNLKDKVDFERGNIDRNVPNIIEPIDQIVDPEEDRPKRVISMPKKWNDYVIYKQNLGLLE